MSDLTTRIDLLLEKLGTVSPEDGCPLLDDAQFTKANVQQVAGVSAAQLHNWTSRGWLPLSGELNPGKGRRRLYTGKDALAVRLAADLAPYSMIQVARQIYSVTGWLDGRAAQMLQKCVDAPGRSLFVVMLEDDWLFVHEKAAIPHFCRTYTTIEIDKLIVETLERLAVVANEEEVSPLSKPVPPTREEAKREAEEFFCALATDEQGRSVRTGLSFEQTAEFDALEARYLSEGSDQLTGQEEKRYKQLRDVHVDSAQAARFAEIGKRK